MWANSKTGTAVLFALGLVAACGKTNTTESGETHFVTCETDVDCNGVSGAHTCDGGLCRGPANTSSSAGTSSASSTPTPACSGGCGDSECAAPGSCTLESACRVVDCGSALVDDNACLRPSCETDDACPDDERCTAMYLGHHSQCKQTGSTCDCTAGLGLFPVKICSPTKLAGARGSWQQIVVDEIVIGDSTVHTITPDGVVTIGGDKPDGTAGQTTTAQLSAEDLDQLTLLINGPALRLALADPQECELTKEQDIIVDLMLDASRLEKNVAGCVSTAKPVGSFAALMDLVRKY
jgi:hypothetical protein